MKQKQMVYQKFILFTALVLSSITFLYSLGFATDLYSLNYHSDPSSSLLYVKGAELYYQVQPFNKALLGYTTIMFGLCIAMFITLTHRRRLYYPTNYITTLAYVGYSGFVSITILLNAFYVKQQYVTIDFEHMKEVIEMLNMRYVESTFMMDFGIVLSGLLFLLIAGLIINLIWKTKNMTKEKNQNKGA